MAADSEMLRDSASNSLSQVCSKECVGTGLFSDFSERIADAGEPSTRLASPAFIFTLPDTLPDEKSKRVSGRKKNISGADIARIALSVSDGRSRSPQARHDSPIDSNGKNADSLSMAKSHRFLAIFTVCAAAVIIAALVAALLLSL